MAIAVRCEGVARRDPWIAQTGPVTVHDPDPGNTRLFQ